MQDKERYVIQGRCPHGYACEIYLSSGMIYAKVCDHQTADSAEVRALRRKKKEEEKLARKFRRQLKRL